MTSGDGKWERIRERFYLAADVRETPRTFFFFFFSAPSDDESRHTRRAIRSVRLATSGLCTIVIALECVEGLGIAHLSSHRYVPETCDVRMIVDLIKGLGHWRRVTPLVFQQISSLTAHQSHHHCHTRRSDKCRMMSARSVVGVGGRRVSCASSAGRQPIRCPKNCANCHKYQTRCRYELFIFS